VTVAGLGYFILFASAQIVADWVSGSVPFYDYIHIPFIILFGLSIVATWARPKAGYIMSLISGVAGIVVLSPFTFVKGVSSQPRSRATPLTVRATLQSKLDRP